MKYGLFLDLDGTVLGRANALSPATKEALVSAREAGMKIAICTGRTSRGISEIVAEVMAPEGPHIFESGGAIVTFKPERRTLYSYPMKRETGVAIAEVAMDLAQTFDAAAEFYTSGGIYVSKKTEDSIIHAKALGIDPDVVVEADVRDIAAKYDVVRVQWVVEKSAMDHVLERNPEDTTVAVASAHAVPHCLFASVTRTGIDKGTAVKTVAEELWGIPLEDCIAVGDSTGDVPMLKVVGHPYIMGSASEALRETYRTLPDVENDGVATLLRHLLDKGTLL